MLERASRKPLEKIKSAVKCMLEAWREPMAAAEQRRTLVRGQESLKPPVVASGVEVSTEWTEDLRK